MATLAGQLFSTVPGLRTFVATSILCGLGGVANAYDSYNVAAHQLTIPAIQVGQTIYKDVVVSIGLSQIISIGGGVADATADQYVGGVLSIPAVFVNGALYTNVTARVALTNVLYVGSASAALSCGSYEGGGTDGVELYDPENLFTYSLPRSANTTGVGSLVWGAANFGTDYYYTGSLRATLWAVTAPYQGGTIIGTRVAVSTPNFSGPGAASSTQLYSGGYSYSSVSALGAVTTPPPGQYCMVLTLDMYAPSGCASSDGYCTADSLAFTKPAFFN